MKNVKLFQSWPQSWPVVAAFLLLCLGVSGMRASTVPPGFTETPVLGPYSGGLWDRAVGVTFDSSGRMFVWEHPGRVWMKGPTDTNFTMVVSIEEEQGTEGLLGFAIDPNFQANGYIYLLYVMDRHYLLYYGTTNYNPNVSIENNATIGRLTRYTLAATNNFKSTVPNSRLILIGETKTNGFPVCASTHTVGSLVFGDDGTLLISCGDTGSFSAADTGGAQNGSYGPQALADGIITAKENVGSYRAQLVDCLAGKVLRIDPATGNGVPSNPFYNPAKPRGAASRVWALGVRQPFRMSLRPNSGSHNPDDANPGVLYIGDVGFDTRESLKVCTGPGQNFGWPLYEGLELTPPYAGAGVGFNLDINNLDATNAACGGYFSFRQLLKPATTNGANFPPFNNPCNASLKIPTNIPQFNFQRPALDWYHFSVTTRTPTFDSSGNPTITTIGTGAPVTGQQFQGNCSVGGTWYTGTTFPAQYQNKYFHCDWGQGVIKLLAFNTNNSPTSVSNFASNVGPIVNLVQHPFDGSMYYTLFDGDTGTIWKLSYTGNRTPVAAIGADQNYGPGPLTVQFNGSGSSDPDGQALTYSWNWGDGTSASTSQNPVHVFTSPGSTRTNYVVTLTVTDSGGLSASTTTNVSLNNTPPNVAITSPTNMGLYAMTSNTTWNLTASVSDAENSDPQLQYQWLTVLHHNDHNHVLSTSTNHVSSTVLEPVGCDTANIYYYRLILTVTDPNGLATTREVRLFPNCGTTDTPPNISDIANQAILPGQTLGPVSFTITDAQVISPNLQLSAWSSNPTLVPSGNIVFGGFNSNRTVSVTPAGTLSGTATITINVNDGPNDVTDSFLLTVIGTNTPPTITDIPNQSILTNTSTGPLAFTIYDSDTPAGSLVLSNASSNPGLVPTSNIVFGGSGQNRTLTVTPLPDQSGASTITVYVNDGTNTASDSFLLTVVTAQPQTLSITNASSIGIRDMNGALPYPSTINVSGLGGTVSNVTVTLRGFNQTWGSDVDVLLVSPGGQKMMLMSDVGNGSVNNVTLTISDSAAAALPASGLTSGTYRPTNYTDGSELGDNFPSPAPAPPYASTLAAFNGSAPNGTWSLYVMDDGTGDTGTITNGWSLTISTQPGATSNTAPSISVIGNQVTTVNTGTGGLPFTVSDGETAAGSLTVSAFTSNAGLVPTNRIVFGGSGGSRTVSVTPTSNQVGSAIISLNVSDGALIASNSFVLTVNPAPLTVTENSFSRGYGLTNPVLSGSVVGLQAGDVITAGFTTAANTNSAVGVYPITVTLSDPGGKLGIYAVTTNNGTVTVTNALLTVTENSVSRGYGVTNPVLSGTVAGLQAGDVITAGFTTAANTNSAVGAYPITVTLTDAGSKLGNYLVTTNNGTVTVTNALLTVTANNTNKVYGTTRGFGGTEFTLTSGSLFNGNTLTNATLASTGASSTAVAGNYPITITNAVGLGLSNYLVAYSNGTLAVTAAGLTVTANSSNKVYGTERTFAGTEFTITGGSLLNGNTLTSATLASTGAGSTAVVGSYAVSITNAVGSGLGNYAITYNGGNLTVAPASLQITAGDTNKVYGATLNPTGFSATGLVNGDQVASVTLNSAGSVNTAAVGGYAITASGAVGAGLGNYVIGYTSGTLTVGPAILTITASDTNKVYGTTLNPTAYSTAGLLNEDSVTNVILTSAGSVSNAPLGSYSITPSGAGGVGLANYVIGYGEGTLSVGPANLLIRAGSTNKVYGSVLTPTAYSTTGLLNEDSVTNVSLASTGSVGTAPVANYAINAANATGTGLTNYSIGYSNGVLIVAPAPLMIEALDTNKVYGVTLAFVGTEFVVTGLTNADSVSSVSFKSDGAAAAAAPGNYLIEVTNAIGSGLTNYAITYVDGELSITGPIPPFEITSIVVSDGVATITWNSVSNAVYRLQYADDPASTNWNEMAPVIVAPGASTTATNSVGEVIQRFYRVQHP